MKKTRPSTILLIVLTLLCSIFIFASCKSENPPIAPTSEKTKYTIQWIDENGNMLLSESIEEGEVPSYSYIVADTAEWDYSMNGWAAAANGEVLAAIPAATKDAIYYARVSAVKQKYTVTFNSNGGSVVSSQIVEYGNKATLPEEPIYEGHRFVGWSLDTDGSNKVDFDKAITANVEYFAIWNEIVDIKGLLSTLLNGYELNPYSYIPNSMMADFSANLVDEDKLVSDYSNFVNVSNINYGHGEQWHMVLDNLNQSKMFFNVLSVLEGLSTISIASFNNYFDSNPSDTAHHEFASGVYNVTINFEDGIMAYVLNYTAELPVLGKETVQIALTMDAETSEKTVRIQLGDANALVYKVYENSYEFAIKYLGVRRAMFSVKRDDDGAVSGRIYEYLTVESVEVASAAEFFITEDYVSVVGNKASGLIGFTGYICELYNTDNGKMLGYEVQETLSAIVYNTLWFNLGDVSGINTLKYLEKDGDTPAKIYVNGSTDAWKTKKVGGIGAKMLSRRFDIEFRTQYVYSYDSDAEKYIEHKIEVPMIFVQEENYNTFIDDVEATNDVTLSVKLEAVHLDTLILNYDELIPVFVGNKDLITSEIIVAYIGDKLTFAEGA